MHPFVTSVTKGNEDAGSAIVILLFLFLVLIKGSRREGECKISLCNPKGGKQLVRFSATRLLYIIVCGRLSQ